MFNALHNLKDIITYSNKLYLIKNVIFFSYSFLILISLNAIIISNLIYYLIIHNFVKIFLINENAFRFLLKTSLLRNVRKAGLKAGPKVSPKASRVLALSWRISLRTRFPRVSYILNQLTYDIHHISF